MAFKEINRIKVVLVEKRRTSKWLAEELNMNTTSISRWCRNEVQPPLETLVEVARLLDVDIRELLVPTKK